MKNLFVVLIVALALTCIVLPWLIPSSYEWIIEAHSFSVILSDIAIIIIAGIIIHSLIKKEI